MAMESCVVMADMGINICRILKGSRISPTLPTLFLTILLAMLCNSAMESRYRPAVKLVFSPELIGPDPYHYHSLCIMIVP